MVTIEEWQQELEEQRAEWGDKLTFAPGGRSGYAHTIRNVEILEGEPPDAVLINFADRWGYNFGGRIQARWTEDDRRFVTVKVYTD
jgi:hypothetical protein